MTQVDHEIEHIKAVQEKYADLLLSKPHVIGVSIGQIDDASSDLALVVSVDKDIPNDRRDPDDQIPEMLENVPVIVRKVGTVTAFTITAHKKLEENQPSVTTPASGSGSSGGR